MQTSTIIKTEAITLRIAPFSNTSHIVTWITPNHGKTATIIKGACRPKSPVFGQYDIGFLCELLFYARNHNGLHIVRECSTIDSRKKSRGNWQITSAISYLCHLTSIATPDGAHAPELYNLLSSALTLATSSHQLNRILFQFELQLLKILGISPQLDNCTSCRANMALHRDFYFSAARGGILCAACHASAHPADTLNVSGDTLNLLRHWQSSGRFPATQSIPDSTAQNQIQYLLGSFLTYHIDLSPTSRNIAYLTANIPPSAPTPI
jgi:DNA repair protein RecO (recombination protein O)